MSFSLKAKTELTQISKVTRVFPNPCTDQITIKSRELIKAFSIYTSMGQLLLETGVNDFETQLSSEKFQKGVYHLHILYEDGKHGYMNILKN